MAPRKDGVLSIFEHFVDSCRRGDDAKYSFVLCGQGPASEWDQPRVVGQHVNGIHQIRTVLDQSQDFVALLVSQFRQLNWVSLAGNQMDNNNKRLKSHRSTIFIRTRTGQLKSM